MSQDSLMTIPDEGLDDEALSKYLEAMQNPTAQQPPVQPVQPVQQFQPAQPAPVQQQPAAPAPPEPQEPEWTPSTAQADRAKELTAQIAALSAEAAAAAASYEMGTFSEKFAEAEILRTQLAEAQAAALFEQSENAAYQASAAERAAAQSYQAVLAAVPALADENSPEAKRYNDAFAAMVQSGMLNAGDPKAWEKVHSIISTVGGIPDTGLLQQPSPIPTFVPGRVSGQADLPSSQLPILSADDLERLSPADQAAYEAQFARLAGGIPPAHIVIGGRW